MFIATKRIASLLVATLLVNVPAHAAALVPFAKNDTWTFLQSRTGPGQAAAPQEIRFSLLNRTQNGDLLLGHATAVTDAGQTIWAPIGSIAPGVCLRDFVGRTNLDLADSCNEGLKVGPGGKAALPMAIPMMTSHFSSRAKSRSR